MTGYRFIHVSASDTISFLLWLSNIPPYMHTASKWVIDLNVRLDTVKLLEENVDRAPFDINRSNICLDP